MNSINKIKKIQYHRTTSDVIDLKEYIVFEDEVNKSKQALFKFHNSLNQDVMSFTFEISQYNSENFLIEKVVVSYNNRSVSNSDFVPESKLTLNYDCQRIECHLVKAIFERISWENGKFSPIPYTLKEFRDSFDSKANENEIKKQPSKPKKKVTITKNSVRVKDVTTSNVPKGYKIYSVIACVLLIAGIFASAFIYKSWFNDFYDGTFQYNINKNDNTCIITGYESTSDEVVIPNVIDDKYTVVGIGKKAFKDSDVTKVKVEAYSLNIQDEAFSGAKKLKEFIPNQEKSELYLGRGVFSECTSLERVELNNVYNIYDYTFSDCTSLTELIVPNATLYAHSLEGCSSLATLEYNNTDYYVNFSDLFGNGSINLNTVITNMGTISANYFGSIPSLSTVTLLNPGVVVEFGAYKGLGIPGYYGNDTLEYNNGYLLVNTNTDEFVIDNFPDNAIDLIFDKIANYCKTLVINNASIRLSQNNINKLKHLNNIIIKDCASIDYDAFSNKSNLYLEAKSSIFNKMVGYQAAFTDVKVTEFDSNYYNCLSKFTNLISLSMPFVDMSLSSLGVSANVCNISYSECIATAIPKNYMTSYHNVRTISFPEGIKSVESNVISNCWSLHSVYLPKSIEEMSVGVIGDGCANLSEVTLPFVGTTSTSPLSYMKVNYSYESTKYLKVLGKTYGGDDFSLGLEKALGIDFEDEVLNTSMLLENCYSLSKLKFTNNTYISDIVEKNSLSLEWLFLDNVNEIYLNYDLVKARRIWMNINNTYNSLNPVALAQMQTILYLTGTEPINYYNVYYGVSETYESVKYN